uniref:Uncharacterized protein n=1 Tax=Mycena chlorophos TaxID=658473 RepID=A0ABQ0KYX5_MYCCL|nr:predicted protein [Mycena chlorophos]
MRRKSTVPVEGKSTPITMGLVESSESVPSLKRTGNSTAQDEPDLRSPRPQLALLSILSIGWSTRHFSASHREDQGGFVRLNDRLL